MILRKQSLLVWLGLALACAAIAAVAGNSINARAGVEELAASGVTAIPVQVGKESYGLALIDAKRETVWIYEINSRGPAHSRLKLLAARNWRYDKLLDEYNSTEPSPQEVKKIIGRLLTPVRQPQRIEANTPDITTLAEPNK